MPNIRISLFSLIMGLIISLPLYSQTEIDTFYQYEIDEYWDRYVDEVKPINFIEIGGLVNIPQAAFKRIHPRVLGGGYLSYSRQYKPESPLFIGTTIAYSVVDSYESEVERDFDGFYEVWDGSSTSSLMNLNLTGKYFIGKPLWIFDPYAELSLGANWFFTNTSFSYSGTDETDSQFEGGSMVLTYGGAIGFMTLLKNDYYLNFSFGYFPGLSASYFVEKEEKDPILSSTIQGFDSKQSTSDMIRIKIGVNFAF